MYLNNRISRLVTTIVGAAMLPILAVAGTVSVDRVVDTVATPVGVPGISYVSNTDGTSTLSVYTDGFVFCGNNGTAPPPIRTLVHFKHQMADTGSTSLHYWALPTENDVQSVNYLGDSLAINAGFDSTLSCLGTAADGAIPTAFADGVFDSGLESDSDTNYRHLLNFAAPRGFDYANPDFSQVPTDPCANLSNQPPLFVENVACAAVTGAKPGGSGDPARSPKLWTYTDGTSFVYLVRVDGHLGQAARTPSVATRPTVKDPILPDGNNSVALYVRDAFDGTYLSGAANAGGQYCTLTTLPSTLNTSVCANAVATPLQNGTLDAAFVVDGTGTTFYIAVIRPVLATHGDLSTPVVAVTATFDRAVSQEGGDNFIGDDIVFGFMPASPGFPWMSGGQ